MSFCVNCGSELVSGAHFCTNCGSTVEEQKSKATRETVYEGTIHKCPGCGEILDSFISNCPSCGCEIRDKEASGTVIRFYEDVKKSLNNKQREYLIRNFPIPNTKEDIIEFMVLASSNILEEENKKIFDAWTAKFEQCYQKSLLILKSEKDIQRVQGIYLDYQQKREAEKDKKMTKMTIEIIARNIAVGVGLILLLIAIRVDKNGGNASMFELFSMIVLIASSASLFRRRAIVVDYIVAAVSGILALGASFLFENGSLVQLCGGIVLILVVINYGKSLMKKN